MKNEQISIRLGPNGMKNQQFDNIIKVIGVILKNKYGQLNDDWYLPIEGFDPDEVYGYKKMIPIVGRAIKLFGFDTVYSTVGDLKISEIRNIGRFINLIKLKNKVLETKVDPKISGKELLDWLK